ncbi:MAG: rhodanese-like domain-containing protein [Gammaproteobacteria bacterium]|nr:rhodanese-like domain-containing protein [Gammaproteobacteria bacterium]
MNHLCKNMYTLFFLLFTLPLMAADDFLVDTSPLTVEGTTAIDNAKAKQLFDEGVTFIDVRTQEGFDKGRIPDSILLDLKKGFSKEALAAVVSPADPLVIYCQGPKCERAATAASNAVSWGYTKVYYYRDGFPGWKKANYPVE